MKKFAILLAAGAAMSAASTAMAGFSTGVQAGPLNSNGPAGDALNGVYTFNYAGPAFLPGNFRFSGDLTSAGIGSYSSEARWRVIAPSGETFTMSTGLPGSVSTFTTQNFSNVTVNTAGALSGVANSVGTWTFRAFESYNDGAAAVDATWSNFSFDFDDYTPPTPPTAFNLGNLAPGGMVMGQNAYVANTVQWYKVTLGAAIPAGELFRVHTAGNTLTGGLVPGDTEIALFNSSGAVIASNDDFSYPSDPWSNIEITTGMAAGDYYIAASAYNLNFSSGFTASAADSGTVTGDIKITVIPAPGSLALLGLGGLLGLRRRRA